MSEKPDSRKPDIKKTRIIMGKITRLDSENQIIMIKITRRESEKPDYRKPDVRTKSRF